MVKHTKGKLLEPLHHRKAIKIGSTKIRSLEHLHKHLKSAPKHHVKKTEVVSWIDTHFSSLMVLSTTLSNIPHHEFHKKAARELDKTIRYLKDEQPLRETVREQLLEHMKDNLVDVPKKMII
jgi:hypothetical protein